VPAERFCGATKTVITLLPGAVVPLSEVIPSQPLPPVVVLADTVKVRGVALGLVLFTRIDWVLVDPFTAAEKVSEDGATDNNGVLLTYSVTGMVSGLPTAALPVAGLVAVTVTVPVQVPGVRLLRFEGVIVKEPFVVPDVAPPKTSQLTLGHVVSVEVTE